MRTIEKTLQNVGRAFLQFGQDFRQKDLGVALRRLYDDVRNPPTGPPPIPQQPGWIMNLGGGDLWTKEHAFEGTQIFGATGSGKTTGSGQKIAIGLLKAGFGGLVLTAKDEEVTTWRAYMEAAKRPSEDLCIFQLGGKYTFNFLEYESEFASKYFDPSIGITLTDNLVRMFCTIMEVSERNQGGGANESFWQKTLRQLLRNAIDLVLFAGEPLSFQKIYDVIITAPTSPYYIENDEDKQSLSWREDSFCWQCMQRADAEIEEGDPRYPDSLITLKYWSKEFPALDPRTRSSIVIQFTSMADVFLRGVLRDLFSPEEGKSKERLDPDVTHLGRVIILNLPVKLYNEIGQFAQVLYKFIWQRATERRNLNDNLRKQRPVFLWADEAQFFVNSNDMLFQTTARSKQAATVYLTQNISNYYALMPGDKGRAETDSILGNFQTKIFHANGDSVTNLWAANLIGMDWDYRENTSTSLSSRDEIATANQGSSIQQHFQHQVLPKRFTTLKKGGPTAENWVEGIIFQAGRVWANKCNYKAIKLKQEFLPPPSDTKSLSSSFWQG